MDIYYGNDENERKHKILFKEIIKVISERKYKLPETIIIYGSFSRYEGNWDMDDNIINDIDLIFIDKKSYGKFIHHIKIDLKNKLGCKFVDITLFTKKQFKKLKKSIFSYDLYQHGKVLHGDLNLEELQFSKELIPLKDVEILFRTRLWTFIGSYPRKGLVGLSVLDREVFNYQLCKAIFACIDCLSVLKKEYNSSYKDKIIWAKNQQELLTYLDLIHFAEDLKLNGNLSNNSAPISLIQRVAKMFEENVSWGLKLFFNSKKKLIDIVTKQYDSSLRACLMKNLYFLKKRDGYKIFNLIVIQYLIFHYLYLDDEIGLKRIIAYSKKLKIKSNDVQTIRCTVAELRLVEL